MLASLASQAATSGGFRNGLVAFAIAAITMVLTLTVFAVVLAGIPPRRVAEIRAGGPRVKRVAGAVLVALGSWFAYLAAANPTYLLP